MRLQAWPCRTAARDGATFAICSLEPPYYWQASNSSVASESNRSPARTQSRKSSFVNRKLNRGSGELWIFHPPCDNARVNDKTRSANSTYGPRRDTRVCLKPQHIPLPVVVEFLTPRPRHLSLNQQPAKSSPAPCFHLCQFVPICGSEKSQHSHQFRKPACTCANYPPGGPQPLNASIMAGHTTRVSCVAAVRLFKAFQTISKRFKEFQRF